MLRSADITEQPGLWGEWERVGQTERVPRQGATNPVLFRQAVACQLPRESEVRIALYDLRRLVNDAAFLHVTGPALLGDVVLPTAQLANGQSLELSLNKDGKATQVRLKLEARNPANSNFVISVSGDASVWLWWAYANVVRLRCRHGRLERRSARWHCNAPSAPRRRLAVFASAGPPFSHSAWGDGGPVGVQDASSLASLSQTPKCARVLATVPHHLWPQRFAI